MYTGFYCARIRGVGYAYIRVFKYAIEMVVIYVIIYIQKLLYSDWLKTSAFFV